MWEAPSERRLARWGGTRLATASTSPRGPNGNPMDIEYTNPDLRQLNDRLHTAFGRAPDLSNEDTGTCRRLAMGMLSAATEVSGPQKRLLTELNAVVEFARCRGLRDVVGWCMSAAHGQNIGQPASEVDTIVSDFVLSRVPPPARMLDVAAGAGGRSLCLA